MRRHLEPNGSYYSARYAERKRAAERERDARGPRPPVKCGRRPCKNMTTRDHICAECRAISDALRDRGEYDKNDAFMLEEP